MISTKTEQMLKRILQKVLWLGRGTATMMGVALMVAVVLGAATTALAAVSGTPSGWGRQVAGRAGQCTHGGRLRCAGRQPQRRRGGRPERRTDRVNGVGKVHVNSGLLDSVSFKTVTATCPDGKVVVGTGYDFTGATTGIFPDKLANVVVEEVYPAEASVHVAAYEEEPTNLAWSVTAIAIRATAP